MSDLMDVWLGPDGLWDVVECPRGLPFERGEHCPCIVAGIPLDGCHCDRPRQHDADARNVARHGARKTRHAGLTVIEGDKP